ncbi:MAG: TatD family hydrolase [bacterium]
MNLVDTHAHLVDEKFRDDLPAVLARAREAGVHDIVVVADRPAEWEPALEVCRREPGCRAALGIHPHVAKDATEADWRRLETLLDDPLVCAVGEAGLDYHYDYSPRLVQKEVFENQVDLAKRWDLPLIVHTRAAWQETFAILGSDLVISLARPRGVIHCFSGGVEEARRAAALGFLLGIGGLITFKNTNGPRDAVKAAGLGALVLETDAPYLAPAPFRGQRNEPARVARVAEAVAEILGPGSCLVRMAQR